MPTNRKHPPQGETESIVENLTELKAEPHVIQVVMAFFGGCACNQGLRFVDKNDPADHPNLRIGVANTDQSALDNLFSMEGASENLRKWLASGRFLRIPLGAVLTKGRGAGGKETVGEEAFKESIEKIRALFAGADHIFLGAGLGGGSGTGAITAAAELIQDEFPDAHLTAWVVMPHEEEEGDDRWARAIKAHARLMGRGVATIQIFNDYIIDHLEREGHPNYHLLDLEEMHALADEQELMPIVEGFQNVFLSFARTIHSDEADLTTITDKEYGSYLFYRAIKISKEELDKIRECSKEDLENKMAPDLHQRLTMTGLQDPTRYKRAKIAGMRQLGAKFPAILGKKVNSLFRQQILKESGRNIEIHLGVDSRPLPDGGVILSLITNGPGPGDEAQASKLVALGAPRITLALPTPEIPAPDTTPASPATLIVTPPQKEGAVRKQAAAQPAAHTNGSNGSAVDPDVIHRFQRIQSVSTSKEPPQPNNSVEKSSTNGNGGRWSGLRKYLPESFSPREIAGR